jgi:cytochrome P450
MLLLQSDPAYAWLDDNAIRRNLGGVIVGAVDTTSWLVNVALDELLKRPAELKKAAGAARANDLDTVRKYAYEAARFHPPTPFLVRYVPRDTTLGGHKVKAGKRLFAMLVSAMFDPATWPDPGAFRIDRTSKHLHFGYGMHQCYGTRINDIQIPAILAAVLRLPNLRRAGGIEWDGPFPNRFMVAFDPH